MSRIFQRTMKKWFDLIVNSKDRLSAAADSDLTMANLTDRLASLYGNRTALLDARSLDNPRRFDSYSYARIYRRVGRFAAAFQQIGSVGRGDRVFIHTANKVETFLYALAVMRLGAAAVMIDGAREPGFVLDAANETGARTIIIDQNLYDRGEAVFEKQKPFEFWFFAGRKPRPPGFGRRLHREADKFDTAVEPAKIEIKDPVAIFLSPNAAGKPQADTLHSGALMTYTKLALFVDKPLISGHKLALNALSFFDRTGLALQLMPLFSGVPTIVARQTTAAGGLSAIEEEKISVVLGSPELFDELLELGIENRDLDSVRLWAAANGVTPLETVAALKAAGRFGEIGGKELSAMYCEVNGSVDPTRPRARISPPSLQIRGRPLFLGLLRPKRGEKG